ncbi:MAG: hypothetical protein PHP61_05350 [Candidatus Izemoplasmatales bacterium]|jgi:hypothetical protein|nr:hypothetical protein [Candidatus Izemoplasmatales bacterium]NLF48138.1 hypothetical protein [Acholeplasmataceae bacterium]MDD4355308.1 hypothetical protein [Candidatus Izemoplasmatales bacterium]MDD4988078.1 hypothetical protein [Candidatus Izemoplasmatales bacterium]MDD5601580.1 hypothetical protein [Candidatus Izemoplasmatales bacterium]
MLDIRKKIAEILLSEDEPFLSDEFAPEEMVEASDHYEYEELYSDLYVTIRNMEDFYGDKSEPKAALLLESFLLEAMVLLKKDPEVILVESGDYFVKGTGYTPDGEAVLRLFENVVIINSMAELYNQGLTEYGLPAMEYGIGIATFPETITEDKDELSQDHVDQNEENDPHEIAFQLALRGNTELFEPIIVNELAYEMLADVDRVFFEENLVKADINELDLVIYHGNIVTDDSLE